MPVAPKSLPPRPSITWSWNQAPRILATLILTGVPTFVVSAFLFGPYLEEGREESRCRYYPRFLRAAIAEIESVPPLLRAEKWPVVGKVAPNITVIDVQKISGTTPPVRAALNGDDFHVLRVFVPRGTHTSVTDGLDDYTLEFMQSYRIKVEARRRREWITMLAVWFVAWALLAWHFLPRLPVTESKAIPNG